VEEQKKLTYEGEENEVEVEEDKDLVLDAGFVVVPQPQPQPQPQPNSFVVPQTNSFGHTFRFILFPTLPSPY